MAASYPTSVKSFTTKADAVDLYQAAHINDIQDEVTAIEQDILTNGLTLTSGKIKFPATQVPSAGVNDLDDYEEGSFTPLILSSGGGTPTYTTQVGGYTKIGRKVFIHGAVQLATKGTLAAGSVSIGGLPFTPLNTANLHSAVCIGQVDNMTTGIVWMSGTIPPNVSAVALNHRVAAAASSTPTTVADIGATLLIIFSGEFITA
jgi:hypothetical protein